MLKGWHFRPNIQRITILVLEIQAYNPNTNPVWTVERLAENLCHAVMMQERHLLIYYYAKAAHTSKNTHMYKYKSELYTHMLKLFGFSRQQQLQICLN